MPSNDNDKPLVAAGLEAQGHAALVLVEALLHGLIERSVLTTQETLDVVATALDVQADLARDADDAQGGMWAAHVLLTRIAESLRIDAPEVPDA